MPVLIGGSPSTGSSLLRQILNRHSAIYCGPETQLFTHPQLFAKWDKAKNRLLRKPLLISPDVHLTKGATLAGDEQGWDLEELYVLIDKCTGFQEFCEAYFSRSCLRHNSTIWMDKTPSNVLSFNPFLNTWGNGHVVHITRNPLDIVASLMQRGHSLFLSVSRYLFNTAHALSCKDNANYLLVKYESLVTSPQKAIEPLLGTMELIFEAGMLEEGNPQMTEAARMPGWRSSEIEAPNQRSIGRFNSLTEEERMSIIASLDMVRVNPVYARKHGLSHFDSLSIAESLGYEIPSSKNAPKHQISTRLHMELRRYRKRCLRERRLFYERERPIVLSRD